MIKMHASRIGEKESHFIHIIYKKEMLAVQILLVDFKIYSKTEILFLHNW